MQNICTEANNSLYLYYKIKAKSYENNRRKSNSKISEEWQ